MSDNEMRILKEFIIEFSPFYTMGILDRTPYEQLCQIIKCIAKKL